MPGRVRQFRKCSLESVAGRLKDTVKPNETRNLELIKVHTAQGVETRKDPWKMYEGSTLVDCGLTSGDAYEFPRSVIIWGRDVLRTV